MDITLKTLLILALVGLGVGLAAAIVFAWSNPASKTIAISTGTLFGAALLFLLQLAFELRASEESDFVSVEFTIDRAQPLIRQWNHTRGSGPWRLSYEHDASEWLARNSPNVFGGDRERLTHDLVLAEVVLFFARQEFDWQLSKTTFVGSTSGRQIMTQRVSKKNDCTELSPASLAEALTRAGNLLAGFQISITSGSLCFPPSTTMTLTDSSLILSNPFGSLQFVLVPSGGISYMRPETAAEVPTLPSGEAQFETRVVGIRITNRQAALYSQHRDASRQAAWRKRVVSELRLWFEQ